MRVKLAILMFLSLIAQTTYGALLQSATVGNLNMTKQDLASSGLSIILPSEPFFDSELLKLGLHPSADTEDLKPFSVILKNSSKRSVVAFALRWTVVDATGHTTTHDHSYVQTSGLLDGGRARRERAEVEHQIRQGASRFVVINGMAQSVDELHALASGFRSNPPQFSITSVLLDAAVFDDGEAIGADHLGMIDRFKAQFAGEQDLVLEIDSRLSRGEIMRDILADIRSKLPFDKGAIPTTPAAIYDQTRRQLLIELETTERNFGDEAAKRTLAFRKYDKQPDIHRKPEN